MNGSRGKTVLGGSGRTSSVFNTPSKKTHNGFWERLRLLRDVSAAAYEATVALTVDGKGSTKVAPDDVLDAMVAALTATAPCTALRSLPANPRRDEKDLPMRMLYTTRDHVRV